MAVEMTTEAMDYPSLNGTSDYSNGMASDDTSRSSRTENDSQLAPAMKLSNGSGTASCDEGFLQENCDKQESEVISDEGKCNDKLGETTSINGVCSPAIAKDAMRNCSTSNASPVITESATKVSLETCTPVSAADKSGPTPPTSEVASKAVSKPLGDVLQIRPMASVLFSIGQCMVQRTACSAKRQQLQKAKKVVHKKDSKLQDTQQKLDNEYKALNMKLARFQADDIRCKGCLFSSPLSNVIELHKEIGHGHDDMHFRCAFCHQFSTYRESEYVFHVEAEHNRVARVLPRKSPFECPLCPFETRNSSSYSKHIGSCARHYNPKRNQEPTVADNDVPIKKLRYDLELGKDLVASAGHKVAAAIPQRSNVVARAGNANMKVSAILNNMNNHTGTLGNVRPIVIPGTQNMQPAIGAPPIPISVTSSSSARIVQIGNQWYNLVPSGDRGQFTAVPIQAPPGGTSLLPPSLPIPTNPTSAASASRNGSKSVSSNSRNISKPPATVPLPINQYSMKSSPADSMESIISAAVAAAIAGNAQAKQSSALLAAAGSSGRSSNNRKGDASTGNSGASVLDKRKDAFERCEMCDEFVKDRAHLRGHFETAHKIYTEAKLFNEPAPILSCLKCTKRFWTYQGLSRHSKIDHESLHGPKAPALTSLKSSVIPQSAPSSLPSSSSRRSQQQQQQQTSAFPTYTCSICQERRIRYVLSHLKSKHNINVSEILAMKQCPCCGVACSSADAVLIHVEAQHPEIISDPALKMYQLSCHFCAAKFTTRPALEEHYNTQHCVLCKYCDERFPNSAVLHYHVSVVHANERKECPLCGDLVNVGAAFTSHMKVVHLKKCSVRIARLLLSDSSSKSVASDDSFSTKSELSPLPPASPEQRGDNIGGEDACVASNGRDVTVIELN